MLTDDRSLERLAVPDEHSVIARVSLSSDMRQIEEALKSLKDEYRELVILRYIEGLSTGEIARILDKRKGAVRVTLHRALAALREE